MIVGVTGKIASGKDTVAKFFEEKGFQRLSLSDEIREELREEGRPTTRENEVNKANNLRKKHGEGILARRVIDKMEDGKDYVVVSIRNPGEVEELREAGDFVLVRVEADAEKRFEFMLKAKQQKQKDDYAESWEEFQEMDERELENEDPKKQRLNAVMEMADFSIKNHGTLDELKEKTDSFINHVKSK